jgi:hypothetical protein
MIEAFYIDDTGRRDGLPFVLPHAPGETAYGLVAGWYAWDAGPKAPGDEPEGPYDTEREAIEAAE